MQVTQSTKLPPFTKLYEFLDEYAALINSATRQFYVDWQIAKHHPTKLIAEYQNRYGLTWHQVNSIHRYLKGKVDSIKECLKRQIANIEGQINAAQQTVKKLDKQVKDAVKRANKKRNPELPEAGSQQKLRFRIHQKKRRIAHLQAKLERLKNTAPRLIFGGQKLWKAQFNLEANGYATLEEWRMDWEYYRNRQFGLVGKASDVQGNRSVQWFPAGFLRISVPPALRGKYGDFIELHGVQFPYGQDVIETALSNGQAVTHCFINKEGEWYLHTSVDRKPVKLKTYAWGGMMGVDLNPQEVGWAITDVSGNLVKYGQVKFDLTGLTSQQAEQILSLVVKQVVEIALQYAVPIVVEQLDFTSKKRHLREKSNRYARMLSGFAYNKFDQLLTSRCERLGVQLLHKIAAWSSLIGLVKYMRKYGMNSASAAALVLARRGQGFSERLPASYARLAQVDEATCVRGFPPLSKVAGASRHVWNHWGTFKKRLVSGLERHQFFNKSVLDQTFVVKLSGGKLSSGKSSAIGQGSSSRSASKRPTR